MGTFGGGTFGGPGGGSGGTAGVPLSGILNAALRIAGITWLPGTTPGIDAYNELIPALNAMMDSYSLDGHRVYTSTIIDFPLTAGQKVYTIGPGAEFDTPRPIQIAAASILFPTDPTIRYPMRIILDEKQWMNITVQDIAGAPPWLLFYDAGYDENGWAKIYLYYQPTDGYTLELATWLQLQTGFTFASDVVVLPPGYEEMIRWNLGLTAAGMYPLESKIHPQAEVKAYAALQAIIVSNSKCPALRSEAAYTNRRGRGQGLPYGWWLAPGG